MESNVKKSEIDALEKVLNDFKNEWEVSQSLRAKRWRKYFLISCIITLVLSSYSSSLSWVGLAVIGYFAGSLFSMLRQNAKTNAQIIEHQHQLKLVSLLRKFQASPYSKE